MGMELMVEWLKKGLEKPGKSQAGLARALGVHPAAVNRLMKGERKLKITEIANASAYFGMPMPMSYEAATPRSLNTPDVHPMVSDAKLVAPIRKDLPAYGTAGSSDKGGAFFMNTGEPQAYIERPAMLERVNNAYAVFVYGESMEPALRQGWAVWVDPNRPVSPGDDVVIELRDGQAFIKRLKRRTAQAVIVEQHNPPADIEFKPSEVKNIHLIVGSTRVRA